MLEGKVQPDYAKVVGISTASAQKELVPLAVMSIAVPIMIGLTMGVEALGGFLGGSIFTGSIFALLMANAGGLWDTLKPEELASFAGFMANPELVQKWYQHRREIANSVRPNPAHLALAQMEELFDEFTVITQNIDNLHQQFIDLRNLPGTARVLT